VVVQQAIDLLKCQSSKWKRTQLKNVHQSILADKHKLFKQVTVGYVTANTAEYITDTPCSKKLGSLCFQHVKRVSHDLHQLTGCDTKASCTWLQQVTRPLPLSLS